MADLHVLDGTGSSVRVACHVPVPDALNLVGVSYRAARLNSGKAAASCMATGTGPGQIAQAEQDQLLAGTLAEIVLEARPEAKSSTEERIQMYRETWDQARELVRGQLESLRWFGATFSKGGSA